MPREPSHVHFWKLELRAPRNRAVGCGDGPGEHRLPQGQCCGQHPPRSLSISPALSPHDSLRGLDLQVPSIHSAADQHRLGCHALPSGRHGGSDPRTRRRPRPHRIWKWRLRWCRVRSLGRKRVLLFHMEQSQPGSRALLRAMQRCHPPQSPRRQWLVRSVP